MHTLACLTRQGAEELTARLLAPVPSGQAAAEVKTRRVVVNMIEGKMLVEFDAAEREALEKWLKAGGFHFDWLMRIEFESEGEKLAPV